MTKYNYQLEPHHLASFRGLIEPLSTELADDPKALEEVIQGIIKSPNPLASLRGKLFELSNSPDAPDLAKELYIGNSAKLEPIEKAVFERPELGINLKPEYKAEQVEEFKEWAALQNTPPTVKDFIEDEAKNYTPWAELEQAGIEAEERGAVLNSTYYKGVNSSIGKMIKNETEASFDELDYIPENVIKEMYLGTSGREFQRSATERIQEALKNAAPEDDKETIKILNELEREEKERWLRIVNAKKDVANMRPETEVMEGEVSDRAEPTEEIKQVRTKEISTFGNNLAYKSLMHIKKGAPVSSIKRQVIEDDRKDMADKNLVKQERLSYYNFGLSSYSREGVKKVAALRLDADDVILFGSRSEAEIKTKEWKEVLIKDSEGIELTPEEVKTSEEYIELGIYDENTFTDFVIVQFNLIDSPRAPL
jgi:thermostable 8-oxoguanine DNA glycosylase